MMKFLISLTTLVFALSAHADLVSTFHRMDDMRKGPFSLNYLQGSESRIGVLEGEPLGTFQFQAAFRNEVGQALATQFDFYVANLFTTNYYELMGEYVFHDAYGSHPLDHQGLLNNGGAALPKAASMVRHWVLEKHYVNFFPNSAIVRGFKLRGISGAEFEQEYATYFFNFYLTVQQDETQFLPAFLLTKGSPIADSSSLDRARDLIAACYDDYIKGGWDPKSSGMRRLYDLRNIIHNSLSQSVIAQIDQFENDYPDLGSDPRLSQVQEILRAYYGVSAAKVADLAGRAGANAVRGAAQDLANNGGSVARYLALSQALADLRGSITNSSVVPTDKKTANLVVLFVGTQYLNKEILKLSNIDSKDVLKAVVNLLYTEGFLIHDNWQYFVGEVTGAADVKAAAALLPDLAEIAGDTLNQAFQPALGQWISIEPKMQYFIDNTIKSSAMNTASVIAGKIH